MHCLSPTKALSSLRWSPIECCFTAQHANSKLSANSSSFAASINKSRKKRTMRRRNNKNKHMQEGEEKTRSFAWQGASVIWERKEQGAPPWFWASAHKQETWHELNSRWVESRGDFGFGGPLGPLVFLFMLESRSHPVNWANTCLWHRVCLTLQITKLSALRIIIPFQQHQQVFCESIHSSLNIICQSPDTFRFCTSFINFSYLTTCKVTKSYPPRSQNPTPNPLSRQKALLINRKQQQEQQQKSDHS